MNTTTTDFKGLMTGLREDIKAVAAQVVAAKPSQGLAESNLGEMIANVTLAYRHLEDASMRLGKAIQAYEGGDSVYDKGDQAAKDAALSSATETPKLDHVGNVIPSGEGQASADNASGADTVTA